MPNTRDLFSAQETLALEQQDILLSGPDSAMTSVNVSRMASFPYLLPEATLRASLDLALQENPVLTGRLVSGRDNHTFLRCNNMGLLLVVKYYDTPIPTYGYDTSPRGKNKKICRQAFFQQN